MSEKWGQPVLVENRGGAAGNIGTEAVVRSPADGYTLLLGTMSTHAMNQFLYAGMSFDPVKDLAPISLVANVATVLVVHPSLPVNNVNELVALAKIETRPAQLRLRRRRELQPAVRRAAQDDGEDRHRPHPLQRRRPGRGRPRGRQGGHAVHGRAGDDLPHQGRAASSCSRSPIRKRAAALPDTPTVGESLPGFEFNNWYGIMAPAGTPRGTIDFLNAEVQRILTLPEVKEKFAALGADPTPARRKGSAR